MPNRGEQVGAVEILPPEPGYDEWREKVIAVAKTYRRSLWELGDLLNEGQDKYGELFAQTAADTGLADQTLHNALWICRRFPKSRRREETLSFALHMEVAKVPDDYQDRILDACERFNWRSKEVRLRVKAALAGDEGALLPDWTPPQPQETESDAATDAPEGRGGEPDSTPALLPPPPQGEATTVLSHIVELARLIKTVKADAVLALPLTADSAERLVRDAGDIMDWLVGIAGAEPADVEREPQATPAEPAAPAKRLTKKALKTIFNEGHDARAELKPLDANPHEGAAGECWAQGWQHADDEVKRNAAEEINPDASEAAASEPETAPEEITDPEPDMGEAQVQPTYEDAFRDEGSRAFALGRKIEANPYTGDTAEHDAWRAGWLDGEAAWDGTEPPADTDAPPQHLGEETTPVSEASDKAPPPRGAATEEDLLDIPGFLRAGSEEHLAARGKIT